MFTKLICHFFVGAESCGFSAPQTDMEDGRNPSIKKSLFPLFSSKNSLKHNSAVKVLPVVASPMVQHQQPPPPYPASPVIQPRQYDRMITPPSPSALKSSHLKIKPHRRFPVWKDFKLKSSPGLSGVCAPILGGFGALIHASVSAACEATLLHVHAA